jgi:hypothetical protein
MVLALAACGNSGSERLSMIDVEPDGTEVWYDNERREVCTAFATEESGTRCFPRFTRIDPSDMRYADSACEAVVVWVDLEQPWHAYVADASVEPRIMRSIYKIVEPVEAPETVEPHALLEGECGPYPISSIRSIYRITRRIHPEEFAPVEM